MKKIIIALMFLSLLNLCVFSQTDRVTRPRIVTESDPTPTPAPIPELQPPPPPYPVEDDEVLNIETNLVTLPVSVLDDKGRFISDLQEADFNIFENGIQQQIDYFSAVESPFTVILLLDVSPSTKYKINEIQDAAISFVDQLRRDDQLIVLTFSDEIRIISRQKTNFHRVRSAIRKTRFGNGTSIYETVDYAVSNLLDDIPGRKAIVILSDGVDTSSRRSSYGKTVKQIEKIDALVYAVRYNTFDENQNAGNTQYSIGASPAEYRKGKAYLTDLTRASGGRMYEAETTESLESAFQNIADELRQRYSIGYYPAVDGVDGESRDIRIRVKRANYIVKSKEKYVFSSKNKD